MAKLAGEECGEQIHGRVKSLAQYCVETVSTHLHLFEAISNLPEFIARDVYKAAQQYLTLRNGKLQDEGLQTFLELHASILHNDTGLGDGGIGTLERMEALNLPWCRQLTNEAPQVITHFCPNLVYLDLAYCSKLDDNGVISLANGLPRLKSIILTASGVGDAGVTALVRKCKDLFRLNIEICKCVTDRGVQTIARSSKLKLQYLNIGGCNKISNISFQIIGEHLKNLVTLNLAGCDSLIDFDVEDVCKNCLMLEELSLRACWRLTDGAARHIANLGVRQRKRKLKLQEAIQWSTSLPNPPASLKRLDIGGCSRITEKGLHMIFGGNKLLEEIDLRGLSNLTPKILLEDISQLLNLKSLIILGMKLITQAHLDQFLGLIESQRDSKMVIKNLEFSQINNSVK